MAKKQKFNILEMHIEKIALAVSIIIVGVVVFFRFVKTSGVEMNGRKLKPSIATQEAAKTARAIQDSLKKVDNKKLPVYKPVASHFIKDQYKALQVAETPLTPPLASGGALEKRIYQIPNIPDITDTKIQFTRALVKVPTAKKPAAASTTTLYMGTAGFANLNYEQKDLDFVTVEGTFPMAELYKLFEDSFGPGVKDPLEIYEPVVAYVQLEHQYLQDDGTWSEPELVSRLDVDPMARLEIPMEELNKLSPTAFQVKIGDRRNYRVQLALLQPQPYSLVTGQWLPPDQAGQEKQGGRNNRRQPRNRNPQMPGMMPGMGMPGVEMPGMMPGMEMPGMMPGTGMGMPGMPGRTARPEELKSDDFKFWAHDGNVKPGKYYKYRIRVGFFNPVANHDWFTPEQKYLKNQRVLWSPWTTCDQLVRVPPRTIFFPKASGIGKQERLRAEVCHRQDGKWYRRSFPYILPAISIGSVIEEKAPATKNRNPLARPPFGNRFNQPGNRFAATRKSATTAKPVKVDYRTNVIVIDIEQNVSHWFGQASRLSQVNCSDLIYMDGDGVIGRLPSDKNGWDTQKVQDQLRINKILKNQSTREQRLQQQRGGRFMPGMGGMPGRGGRAPGQVQRVTPKKRKKSKK